MAQCLDPKEATQRVKTLLAELGDFGSLEVRPHGAHIVIGPASGAFARLTALGQGAFGLSFRDPDGGWEPMLLVDTLEEIVLGMTAAMSGQAS